MDINKIQQNITTCFKIYENYSWLLNCYVLDFFTEDHWQKLLKHLQLSLCDLTPTKIAELLSPEPQINTAIWPLSILAVKSLIKELSVPRIQVDLNEENPYFLNDDKLLNIFWKNVKFKKRHEVSVMSKICSSLAKDTGCFYVVDIGAGLGHLSRMLNYGYKLKVCTIEAQESLTGEAKKLDEVLEKNIEKKYKTSLITHHKTTHINMRIEEDITLFEFLQMVKNAFKIDHENQLNFGIVGLHPCGNLAATLLRIYNECPNVQYINIAGCCYMKLTTLGFPLSEYCRTRSYNLSYHSREIACHAIENYVEKLLDGETWRLKIHCYRALLEKVIVQIDPKLRHSALSNVKYSHDLTFQDYCKKAVKKLGIDIPEESLQGGEIEVCLSQWNKVVIFYSLRLMFAPLVESIILLDRLLYVQESGSCSSLLPVFNSKISPRVHVLTAKKQR